MIIAVDTETQGKNGEFILGSIARKNFDRHAGKRKKIILEEYYNKKQFYERIKYLARKERHNGKRLKVYAHNAEFDFYKGFNFDEKGWIIKSSNPFIANYYNEEGKEEIKLIDSYNFYRMKLDKASELLGLKKGKTPNKLKIETKNGKPLKYTKKELKEIMEYCKIDSKNLLVLMLKIVEEMRNEGHQLKNLTTMPQVSINYIIRKLNQKDRPYLFCKSKKKKLQMRKTIKTKYKNLIIESTRAGYSIPYKTGIIEGVTSIDFNSSYAKSLQEIKMPDLRTERIVRNPLNIYEQKRLLKKIGISKVVIKNVSDEYGMLPVRTEYGIVNNTLGKIIVGTYTNIELDYATRNGWKILWIDWSVIYDEAVENPFKKLFEEMFEKRKKSKWHNYFWKSMIVSSIGKLAQRRTGMEVIIDNVEETARILSKNPNTFYEGFDDERMIYTIKPERTKPKDYYTPIITSLTYGLARVMIMKEIKKIPINDLVYTDTDNIAFVGRHLKKFEKQIGERLGMFKIEKDDEGILLVNKPAIIYGKKSICIGNKAKASGVNRELLKREIFEKGHVEVNKMITLKTSNNKSEIGKFKTIRKDFFEQQRKYNEKEMFIKEEKVIIDVSTQKLSENAVNVLDNEILKWQISVK